MLLQRPADMIRGAVGDTSESPDRRHAIAKVIVEEREVDVEKLGTEQGKTRASPPWRRPDRLTRRRFLRPKFYRFRRSVEPYGEVGVERRLEFR